MKHHPWDTIHCKEDFMGDQGDGSRGTGV